MTRITATSIAALEMGTEESQFYQAKPNTAKFFMTYWGSQTRSLRKQIESSSTDIVEFSEADF